MKKIVIPGGVLLLTLTIFSVILVSFKEKTLILDEVELQEFTDNSTGLFAIMVENSNGEYEEYTGESFPTDMVFNTSMSNCINNNGEILTNILSFNSITGAAIVEIGETAFCYLYFDIGQTFADTILLAENNSSTVSEAVSYIVSKGEPDFTTTSTTDEGLYAAEDDYGTSYYFRGSVEDNYVYFAGFYWRIVRINGDGSVRLIYDGSTQAYDNGESNIDRILKLYSYSSSVSSDVEDWYVENLLDFETYLSDSAFCEDYTVYVNTSDAAYFASYGHLVASKSPVLTCTSKYTLSVTGGSLTYPIYSISADEVAMAGGVWNTTNVEYYLYTGYSFWTSSPFVNSDYGTAYFAEIAGKFSDAYTSEEMYYYRPVINISSSVVVISGDGTIDYPYELILN